MKKFIINIAKFILLLSAILAIPTALYVKKDVYADFGIKQNYSWKYFFQSLGDVSTKKLIHSDKNYNSFIFGSSRACSVYACYLQEKIPSSSFFHYANWGETVGGMYKKLKLIDDLSMPIENAIIYIDTDFTFEDNGEPRENDHYLITEEKQHEQLLRHYRSFFSNINSDKLKLLMGGTIEGDQFPNWESDKITNDSNYLCNDANIEAYGEISKDAAYLSEIDSLKNVGFLYERPRKQAYKASQISDTEKAYLSKIKTLLDKHQTQYYVIITPLYDQLKFSDEDYHVLSSYFGEHLYDFSGISEITNDASNYPDKVHFLRHISKEMLDSVIKP